VPYGTTGTPRPAGPYRALTGVPDAFGSRSGWCLLARHDDRHRIELRAFVPAPLARIDRDREHRIDHRPLAVHRQRYVVPNGGLHPNPRRLPRGSGCACWRSTRRPPRWCRGSSPSTWTAARSRHRQRAQPGRHPCPSARRPDQNRYRLADGWWGGTVRSILDNPRYTGYAVFGRRTREERLAEPRTTSRPVT
jgi:hypothetical protein